MSEIPQFGKVAIYQYLRALIGTDKAWRTSSEVAEDLGAKTDADKLRVQQGLLKLSKDARITRKWRAGTKLYECMALILDAKDELRAPRVKPKPPRSEIVTPAAGVVAMRVEAAPAPVLPEPSPEAREAVEKLVRSPTPALTLADVLRKHSRSISARDPKVAQSGPLSDSNGPISSDTEAQTCSMPPPLPEITPGSAPDAAEGAAVAPTLDVKAELAGIAERCAADADDDQAQDNESTELADELRAFGQLIERGKREAPAILYRDTKLTVLRDLAELAPPLTAYYLREIAADIERAGA